MKQKAIFILLISCLFCSPISAQLKQIFVTDSIFRHPESVVIDRERDYIYVSNMDKNTPVDSLYTDCISRLYRDGNINKVEWVTGLSSPTGMVLYKGLLYVVERTGLAIIDPDKSAIIERIPIPGAGFLNDISISPGGTIFIGETEKEGRIYKIQNKTVELWIQDTLLALNNGLLVDGEYLLVGVNGDGYLKKINLYTKEISPLVYLGPGNIDGIQLAGDRYLVSHFMGNLYKITPGGAKFELINTRDQNLFIADFAYDVEDQIIIIPSLRTNRLYIFSYEK